MHSHTSTRLSLVALSSLMLACSGSDPGPDTPDIMATGGADPAGTGGALAASGGDSASPGSGGGDPTGSGGGDPTSTGGESSTGGAGTSTGGSGEPATGGSDGGGLKNPPIKSAGCGQPAMMTTGKKTIMSGGTQREYIIDVPAGYDPEKPYRLFYASHGLGGAAEHVADWWNYFGLKTQAERANEPAIFIAPQAIGSWNESDHALFDDITDLAKENLCVDTTRVFVTGMSFGGMITYSLSTNHQDSFRAGVALAPANFNIWLPNPKLTDPIPWMQTTGMGDTTTPWDQGNNRGSKYIALEKARDNGCTVPDDIDTWQPGDPTRHQCVDMEGCDEGYPVRVCTFDGGHWQFPYDEGNGEDLQKSWVPEESWKFFTQF